MRISEIMPLPEAADPFKPQLDAAKKMAKDAKVKKAKIKADKAQAALRKAQQT